MKARYKVRSERERLADRITEVMEAQRLYIMYQSIGMMVLAYHDALGLGAIRQTRGLQNLNLISDEQLEWQKDGVANYMLCKNLRRMGMDFLVDLIDKAKEDAENRLDAMDIHWEED